MLSDKVGMAYAGGAIGVPIAYLVTFVAFIFLAGTYYGQKEKEHF